MKAIVFEKYGSPDVLQMKEVEKPTPKADQVLVKIRAVATNPLDWHRMRGEPFFLRLSEGLRKPSDTGLGADIAGVVEAVGENVTEFKVGDAIFGSVGSGGLAEYACAYEKYITHKPEHLSFEEAAAVPIVAFTALQGLRDTGKIKAGQKVLVNGASGGVGSFAVQIAKSYGTEVTGVCSTRNLELVRLIGADHVVDYTQDDFTKMGQRYDLIYDAVGNRSAFALRRALAPDGICAMAGMTTFPRLVLNAFILGPLLSRFGSKQVGSMGVAKINKDDLLIIKEMLESEQVKPVIDRCYPLEEAADAIAYLEQGHARGKVIVQLPS